MGTSREDSLNRLRHGLDSARAGRSGMLHVRGGIGAGKSWLLDTFAGEIGPDVCVLRCTGYPTETDLPFAGLHQLVRPLLHRVPHLPAPQGDALATALALEEGEPRDRLAVSAGLLALITLEAESRPVVIIVDDLHWLDNSTSLAIAFVARRLDADAVLVVAASRAGQGTELASGFDRVDLAPLDEIESRRLLRERHPELSSAVAAQVIAEADGLPLALVQIPSDLTLGQRDGSEPLPSALPSGSSLDEFYSARLRSLNDANRRALLVASLDELELDQLTRALGALDLSLEDLDPAEHSGLVTLTGDGCEFEHPTVRSAVQRAASYNDVRRARLAVVEALPTGSPRTAWHLVELDSAPSEPTAAALDRAGEEAWRRSAYDEAARAWRASADHTPDAALAYSRRARSVEAYLRLGSGAALADVLDRLASDAPNVIERARWQTLLLITGLYADQGAPPREQIDALSRRLLEEAPAAAARLSTTYGLILALEGRAREAAEVIDALRDALPDFEFPLADALLHDDIDLISGRPGAGTLLNSNWADSVSDDELCDPSFPVSPTVVHIAWAGNVELASRIIDRQIAALRAGGGISLLDLCLAQRAIILQLAGNWDEANAAYANAGDVSRVTDFAAPLPHIRLRHAYLLAARGDEATARQLVAEVQRLPAASRSIHQHLIECTLGLLELTVGNAADAVPHLEEAGRLEREMGMLEPSFFTRFSDHFDALWRLRREGEALAELQEFEARARRLGRHSAMAVALRCRGLIADADRIDELFDEATRLHALAPDPFESARTELAWGQRLRRERRKADARTPLHRALDTFEHLGAEPWAAAARSELAACGERRVAASVGPLGTLTPREFEVASAVAGGATNAEAAARLFVSQRTVEYHLSAVFRKLGVQGRTSLAAALHTE